MKTSHRLRIILANPCIDGVSVEIHAQTVCLSGTPPGCPTHSADCPIKHSDTCHMHMLCWQHHTTSRPTCHHLTHTNTPALPLSPSPFLIHVSQETREGKKGEKERKKGEEEKEKRKEGDAPYCWCMPAMSCCSSPMPLMSPELEEMEPQAPSSSSSHGASPMSISHYKVF